MPAIIPFSQCLGFDSPLFDKALGRINGGFRSVAPESAKLARHRPVGPNAYHPQNHMYYATIGFGSAGLAKAAADAAYGALRSDPDLAPYLPAIEIMRQKTAPDTLSVHIYVGIREEASPSAGLKAELRRSYAWLPAAVLGCCDFDALRKLKCVLPLAEGTIQSRPDYRSACDVFKDLYLGAGFGPIAYEDLLAALRGEKTRITPLQLFLLDLSIPRLPTSADLLSSDYAARLSWFVNAHFDEAGVLAFYRSRAASLGIRSCGFAGAPDSHLYLAPGAGSGVPDLRLVFDAGGDPLVKYYEVKSAPAGGRASVRQLIGKYAGLKNCHKAQAVVLVCPYGEENGVYEMTFDGRQNDDARQFKLTKLLDYGTFERDFRKEARI